MPVLKSSRDRPEIGRCYHRKAPSAEITKDVKEPNVVSVRKHSPRANGKRPCGCRRSAERSPLIYSDFQLNPESGNVRMAFTVPLTTLATTGDGILRSAYRVNGATGAVSHSLWNSAVIRLSDEDRKVGSVGTIPTESNSRSVMNDKSGKSCNGVGCRSKYFAKGFHPWKDDIKKRENTFIVTRPVIHQLTFHNSRDKCTASSISTPEVHQRKSPDNKLPMKKVDLSSKLQTSDSPQNISSNEGNTVSDAKKFVGLTIKNRHAVLVHDTDAGILTAAIKKYETRLSSQVHGSETNSTKSQASVKSGHIGSKKAAKQCESNSWSSSLGVDRSGRDKRQKSLRETTTKKAAIARSSTNARPTGVSSKVNQKTSSVSPAPSRAPSKLTNRFGFKQSNEPENKPLQSGNSTDSVNSILSDAKTNSDLNLNRVGEENGNFVGSDSRDDKSEVLSSISQASSGVTSCLAGKLKTKTKQLPQPVRLSAFNKLSHISTVQNSGAVHSLAEVKLRHKLVSARNNVNTGAISSHNSVAAGENLGQQSTKVQSKSNAICRKSDIESKFRPEHQSKLQIRSHESNTSDGCAITRDSVLKPLNNLENKRVGNSVVQVNISCPNKEVDQSDAWLQQKNSMRMKVDTEPVITAQQVSKTDTTGKRIIENKAEHLTYGAARQKIAPYNRTRFGFSSMKLTQAESKPLVKKTYSSVVRNRIAEIEKTPKSGDKSSKMNAEESMRNISAPKKTSNRITSLEKSPLTPITTETIDLIKPVYRKLQYIEGKLIHPSLSKFKLPASDDGDVLSVSSIATIATTNGEEKCVKDERQTEKSIKRRTKEKNNTDEIVDLNKIIEIPIRSSNDSYDKIELPDRLCSNELYQPSDNNGDSSDQLLNSAKENSPVAKLTKSAEKRLSNEFIDIKSSEVKNSIKTNKSARQCKNIEQNCNVTNECKNTSKTNDLNCNKEINTNHIDRIEDQNSISSKIQLNSVGNDVNETITKCHAETIQTFPILSNVMTSSVESTTKSSSSLSRVSGKCTPTTGSSKEMEQDFFIEDEISDQPGLMLGDAVDLSFLEDDLFEDLSSPSHMAIRDVRSRAESAATLSSIGGEDLILDYDTDDTRHCCRLEGELLSPTVGEVILPSLVKEPSPIHRCISKEVLNNVLVTEGGPVSTKQPLSSELNSLPTESSLPHRNHSESCCEQTLLSSEDADCIVLNRTTAQYLFQDVAAMKSLLLTLQKILTTNEAVNPLMDENMSLLNLNLGLHDPPHNNEVNSDDLTQENMELKRQVNLMQQQMEEKNKVINVLNQQLTQSLQLNKLNNINQESSIVSISGMTSSSIMDSSSCSDSSQISNAATQTDRSNYKNCGIGLSHTESIEDGLGPTVSSNAVKKERRSVKVRSQSETLLRNSISNRNCKPKVLLT